MICPCLYHGYANHCALCSIAQANLSNQPVSSWIPKSFFLNQIDPVEARCRELQSIIREFEPKIPEGIITRCMNRQSLVRAIDLSGKHYQSNLPILHSPTFSLPTCDPMLLLAMFCVGAIYAQDKFQSRDIFKIAIGILIMIEGLPVSASRKLSKTSLFQTCPDIIQHERAMTEPPLSTIQASIAACCVLACSNDEAGAKCVGIYMARSISVAHLIDLHAR